jgi:hypothetical protein
MTKLLKVPGIERLLGIPLIGLLLPLILGPDEHPRDYWYNVAEATTYSILLWQGNWYIISYMRQRYSGYQDTFNRLMVGLSASFLYTTVATTVLGIVIDQITGLPFRLPPHECDFITSYVVTFFVISVYECVYFSERWKESLLESEQLKRENLQSQFETLKTQVSPHFLFNSLNTLITIIPENPEQAVEFVQKLSGVYRYILQTKDKELVLLQQEMEFAQSYLFLMKMRFGENLQISWQVSPQYYQASIPPMALQMLLENAIKHNVVSIQKPLFLHIYTEPGETLVVKNNLQLKAVRPTDESASTKVGLQNVTKRYSYLTKRPVDVIVTTTNFIVTLPLLQVAGQRKNEEALQINLGL